MCHSKHASVYQFTEGMCHSIHASVYQFPEDICHSIHASVYQFPEGICHSIHTSVNQFPEGICHSIHASVYQFPEGLCHSKHASVYQFPEGICHSIHASVYQFPEGICHSIHASVYQFPEGICHSIHASVYQFPEGMCHSKMIDGSRLTKYVDKLQPKSNQIKNDFYELSYVSWGGGLKGRFIEVGRTDSIETRITVLESTMPRRLVRDHSRKYHAAKLILSCCGDRLGRPIVVFHRFFNASKLSLIPRSHGCD